MAAILLVTSVLSLFAGIIEIPPRQLLSGGLHLWEIFFISRLPRLAAILGTWIFVWFIQRIQFKDAVMVPLAGIMFGNAIGGITNCLACKYEMTQALSSWLAGHFSLVLKGRYEIV